MNLCSKRDAMQRDDARDMEKLGKENQDSSRPNGIWQPQGGK
jgi:hypothetical protein